MDVNAFNKRLYSTPAAVRTFGGAHTELQKPEQTILDLLRPQLHGMSMLDIGVGGGRTTHHFAPLVARYIGLDYSPEMIEECHRCFPHPATYTSFLVGDAAHMNMFEEGTFDLLLFSFNGIDVLSLEKKLQVLREVRRIGKQGGYFIFSAHNLQCLKRMYTFSPHRDPKRMYRNIRRSILMRLFNPPFRKVRSMDRVHILELSTAIRLSHLYIRPHAQIEELKSFGFTEIRLFGLNGREIREENIDSADDYWIYYFCRI